MADPERRRIWCSNRKLGDMADPERRRSWLEEEGLAAAGDDEDAGARFTPIDKLELRGFTAGDEDEDVLLDLKAKLYRFDKEGNQLKEQGTGNIKLHMHKGASKVRLIAKPFKICCDKYSVISTTNMQEHEWSDNPWVCESYVEIPFPSFDGNNITLHANGPKTYFSNTVQNELIRLSDCTINTGSYSLSEVENYVKSMNFHDCGILKQQFVPGLPSNPLCSKILMEPYHGIETLNANFSWLVGEHDVNTWVLPIERPLGPGANSSSDFAAACLWLDSGCTHHVVCDYRLLVNCRAPPARKNVRTADGTLVPVRAVGTINIPGFYIPEVYLVPGVVTNLISPGQLAVHHKINSALDAVSCVLWTGRQIDLVGEGIRDELRELYRLTFLVVP